RQQHSPEPARCCSRVLAVGCPLNRGHAADKVSGLRGGQGVSDCLQQARAEGERKERIWIGRNLEHCDTHASLLFCLAVMALVEVPTPLALLGGLLAMALSAHYMTARSKTGVLGRMAALVNMLCFLNASLGVNVVMAITYLFVRPFSAATVRRLNSNFAEAMWADAMSAIMPPSKVVVTGEMPDDDTQAIVIANHQVFWY
ncbi:unnamed protein product, partial [Ectocarpus fasciculatus]